MTPSMAPDPRIQISPTLKGVTAKPDCPLTSINTAGANTDEATYADYRGNFHKGLEHNTTTGLVDPTGFKLMRVILNSTSPADYELIPLDETRKMTNPQAGKGTDVQGPTPSVLSMLSAPAVESPECATEAVELYWMSLLRDVPFNDFASNADVAAAAAEMESLRAAHGAYTGPLESGAVTANTLFRGCSPGDTTGPLISQFLLRDIPYGSLLISQKQETALPMQDFLTSWNEFISIQNGFEENDPQPLDPKRRYIRNMRDMAHYVHIDALYEAYLNACLILLGAKAPLNPGNPYQDSHTQVGFGTFGGPHILSLVTEVATRALKAVWFQKWNVHRRLRPEAFGGLVDRTKNNKASLLSATNPVLSSQALARVKDKTGSYLMPMAFVEGSPTHPAYGAGHATVAGACVTVLKAFFDERAVITNPLVASSDGESLIPYSAPAGEAHLTVGGELNKVAANIAIGRNMGGVHWRSDYTESLKLGEQVAIHILLQQRNDYFEDYHFQFTNFDGNPVRIDKFGIS